MSNSYYKLDFSLNLPDASFNNSKIADDIQNLQEIEVNLLKNLSTSTSEAEKTKIIDQIQQVRTMKFNLYETLGNVNQYFNQALGTSMGALNEQLIAIDIVEKELTNQTANLDILKKENANKVRLVEINTYYGDKYAENSLLMKILIITMIPIIILTVIFNKGYLTETIYYILITIITLIGTYFFCTRFFSVISRDNMNYDEYDWSFDPSKAPVSSEADKAAALEAAVAATAAANTAATDADIVAAINANYGTGVCPTGLGRVDNKGPCTVSTSAFSTMDSTINEWGITEWGGVTSLSDSKKLLIQNTPIETHINKY